MRCSHEDALREFFRWCSHSTPTFPLVLKETFTLLGDTAAPQILTKSTLKSNSILLITRQPGRISDASEFYPAKLSLEALHTERLCPWKTHTCLFRCTKTEVDHLRSEEAESSPCVFDCSLCSFFFVGLIPVQLFPTVRYNLTHICHDSPLHDCCACISTYRYRKHLISCSLVLVSTGL